MAEAEAEADLLPGAIAELAARRGFRIPPEDLMEVTAAANRLLEAANRIEAHRICAQDRDP